MRRARSSPPDAKRAAGRVQVERRHGSFVRDEATAGLPEAGLAGDGVQDDDAVRRPDRQDRPLVVDVERLDLRLGVDPLQQAAAVLPVPDPDPAAREAGREPAAVRMEDDRVEQELLERPTAQARVALVQLPERPVRVQGVGLDQVLAPQHLLGQLEVAERSDQTGALDPARPELPRQPGGLAHRVDGEGRQHEEDGEQRHERRAMPLGRLGEHVHGRVRARHDRQAAQVEPQVVGQGPWPTRRRRVTSASSAFATMTDRSPFRVASWVASRAGRRSLMRRTASTTEQSSTSTGSRPERRRYKRAPSA